MTANQLEMIAVTLKSTMGTDEWEVDVPLDVAVSSLILKFIKTSELGLREVDDEGNRIPYRLMHQEGSRFLGDSETLRAARVAEGHTLVMTYEARAGAWVHITITIAVSTAEGRV